MSELWHGVLPAESLVEKYVQRGTGQPLLTTDDMGDAHEVVVDDVGEVVGGQLVAALVEHLVVEDVAFHRYVAADEVVDGYLLSRLYHEADGVLFAVDNHLLHLLGGDGQGVAHLQTCVGIVLEVLHLVALLLQLFRRVEGIVGLSGVEQLPDVFLVYITALALPVGTAVATEADTFIEFYSEPFEALQNIFLGPRNKTMGVGILNTENKFASMLTGKQIVIKGCPYTTNV